MNRPRSVPFVPVVLLVSCFVAGSAAMALQQQEEKAAEPPIARGFTYDPEGRRDPFVSPADALSAKQGPRPSGIAGMTVDDLDLTGVVATLKGGVASLKGSDGKGYFLRVGDRIYKATVIAVDAQAGTTTFREQVDDSRSIKGYRDRVLRLASFGVTP